MTIVACYAAPDGIVLGADSTSTSDTENGPHYLNLEQKLFGIGDNATVGILTWGLGEIPDHSIINKSTGKPENIPATSLRNWVAQFAETIKKTPPQSFDDLVIDCMKQFKKRYFRYLESEEMADYIELYDRYKKRMPPLTYDEKQWFKKVYKLNTVSFCIAGYWSSDHTPKVQTVVFEPDPNAEIVPLRNCLSADKRFECWGVPRIMERIIYACDTGLKRRIRKSGFWNGSEENLDAIINAGIIAPSDLSMHDAVGYVHRIIASTINGVKYSNMPQTCGGPIELAVIPVDGVFQWVKHKAWDEALIKEFG